MVVLHGGVQPGLKGAQGSSHGDETIPYLEWYGGHAGIHVCVF